jgi:DNA-binding transcriptional MerR regulator
MTENNDRKFSIQMAAQMSGLTAHTIRAWEKRYQALTPARTNNGRRLYTADEVDRLTLLAQLTHLGSNIGQIAKLSEADLKSMYAKVVQSGDLLPSAMIKRDIDIAEMQKQLLTSIAKYEVNIISQLLSLAKNSVEPKIFALEILKPLIDEVKKLFSQNKFQNAQMQALFAIAKFHAGNIIYSHFEKNIKSNHKFVLTGLERENHSFNLLLSALICCHHKKHFYYLNTNLPVVSIVEAVKAIEGTILILSVSKEGSTDLSNVIDEVMSHLSPKVKIWLVGPVEGKIKNATIIESAEKLDELMGSFQ